MTTMVNARADAPIYESKKSDGRGDGTVEVHCAVRRLGVLLSSIPTIFFIDL